MESIKLRINKDKKFLYIHTPDELKNVIIVQAQCGEFSVQCGKNNDDFRGNTFYVDCRKNTHTFDISDGTTYLTFDDDEIIKMFENLNNEISERVREINKKNKKFEEDSQIPVPTVKDIKVVARIVTHPKVTFDFPVELRGLVGSKEVLDFGQFAQKNTPLLFHFFANEEKSSFNCENSKFRIVILGLNNDGDDGDNKTIVCKLNKKDSRELLKVYTEEQIVEAFMNFTSSIRKKYDLKHINSSQKKKLTTYYF